MKNNKIVYIVFNFKDYIKTAYNSGLAILPFSFSAENPQ